MQFAMTSIATQNRLETGEIWLDFFVRDSVHQGSRFGIKTRSKLSLRRDLLERQKAVGARS